MHLQKNPEQLLEEFNNLLQLKERASDIEIKILTSPLEYVMAQLADSDYKPASPVILDYTKKIRLTSERIAGIKALARLDYKEAIPFIQEQLRHSESWYKKYHNHRNARGLEKVSLLMETCKQALNKLMPFGHDYN